MRVALRSLCWSLAALTATSGAVAAPSLFGDLDSSGGATAADIVRLINHLDATDPLPSELLPFADADRSGVVNQDDVDWIVRSVLGEVGLFAVNPVLRFPQGVSEVNEGDPAAGVRIELSGYAVGTITYEVTGGDATQGGDYATLSGAVDVNGSSAVIPLGLVDDLEREGFESIGLRLTGLSGFALGLPSEHTVFIGDDDKVWSAQLVVNGAVLPLEMEILRQGGEVMGGRLLSDGDGTVPAGIFDLNVTFTESLFQATAGPISVGPEETLFGVPITRTFTFSVTDSPGQVIAPAYLLGTFQESFDAPGAPHLNLTNSGQFQAAEQADGLPVFEPTLVTLP